MGKNKFHDGPGPSQRQLRVGELIRRTLSEVLARGDVWFAPLEEIAAYAASQEAGGLWQPHREPAAPYENPVLMEKTHDTF